MVYVLYMLPVVSKEPGKAHFKTTMYTAVEGGVIVASGLMGLRADFGFVAGRNGMQALRTGRGRCWDREDPLQCLPLMTLLTGFLNCTIFVVFHEPLWGEVQQGGGM